MTDERLLAGVKTAFAGSKAPITLERIYKSVQAQISGKLTESDRRQIKSILHRHRQNGLIVKNGQGRYGPGPGVCRFGLFSPCGTSDIMDYENVKLSIRRFIMRRGEPFALRQIYGLKRFYDDIVRNRYVVRGIIDELCRAGELEPAGPQRYRATASFKTDYWQVSVPHKF